jgi:hypothetical protein
VITIIITTLIVVLAAVIIVSQLDHSFVPLYRNVDVVSVCEPDDHSLAVPSLSALAAVVGRRGSGVISSSPSGSSSSYSRLKASRSFLLCQ